MDIISIIEKEYDNLSNKQKTIADYLMQNRNKIAFQSLKELSINTKASEVTILNFCKSINIPSFIELKKAFQGLINEELKVPNKMKSSLDELESSDDCFKNTISYQKMNFDKSIEENALSILENAADLIKDADTIYLAGLGVSTLIVNFLESRLYSLGKRIRLIDFKESTELYRDLNRITKNDLCILVSFPEYSKEVVNLSKYLADKKLPFIAITDSNESLIAKDSSVLLRSTNKSIVFYNFISSTIALLERLLVILTYQLKDEVIIDVDDFESTIKYFS